MVTLQGHPQQGYTQKSIPQQGVTQQGPSPPVIKLQGHTKKPNITYQGSYQLGMTPQGIT